ncbi:MAG: DUF2764 family protein [Deltaproteobacteria bacterium]|jgi:hypothetical protein|nr:DUF2764 family protein [Deltaproteobacteria bacterium]MBT4092039.1 DUF2764 family protein [Deltaproteobacteria bacterium]MBT4269376.1 DUF2764 family protein [Deltaproteobacteria bacterium]MBT4638687.1 DUF2764 family protein [Deltaproteobacteria bacterium]MBT6501886.1 DUF2764 family protein [Deltaproteobacteria bacterium]
MTIPYHYIVAGLPDIIFNDNKIELGLGSFINELKDQIPQADACFFSYIGFPNDNKNLINILSEKKEPIHQTGNFSEEELRDEIKNPDQIPEYMQEFIAAFDGNSAIIQNLSWENQLNWLFYEEATSIKNRFLNEWFTFELDLRNILTAITCRKAKDPLEKHLICRNEVTDLLLKSSAPDFSLPSRVPWADELFSIEFDNIATSEDKLARLRLQSLEEIAEPELFNIETVMRVGIALSISERWSLLDDKTGTEKLEKIIQDLEQNYKAE